MLRFCSACQCARTMRVSKSKGKHERRRCWRRRRCAVAASRARMGDWLTRERDGSGGEEEGECTENQFPARIHTVFLRTGFHEIWSREKGGANRLKTFDEAALTRPCWLSSGFGWLRVCGDDGAQTNTFLALPFKALRALHLCARTTSATLRFDVPVEATPAATTAATTTTTTAYRTSGKKLCVLTCARFQTFVCLCRFSPHMPMVGSSLLKFALFLGSRDFFLKNFGIASEEIVAVINVQVIIFRAISLYATNFLLRQ